MTREEVSILCKAMSDSNRLQIIELLTHGEKCGCELLEELSIAQPTLSHHMRVLGDCGLVTCRREGKWSYYTLCCPKFREFKEYLSHITCCDTAAQGCRCS